MPFYFIPKYNSTSATKDLTIGLKRLVQFVVHPSRAQIDIIIDVDRIRCSEVSSPANDSIASDFGDEAIDFLGSFARIAKALAVAETSTVNQIHVNCMTDKMVADSRGFHYGT